MTIPSATLQHTPAYRVHAWQNLKEGDVGAGVNFPDYCQRIVSVDGDLGGGAIEIQGTVDGQTWHPVTDLVGAPLVFRSVGIASVADSVLDVRPVVRGGADVSATVTLLARRGAVK